MVCKENYESPSTNVVKMAVRASAADSAALAAMSPSAARCTTTARTSRTAAIPISPPVRSPTSRNK